MHTHDVGTHESKQNDSVWVRGDKMQERRPRTPPFRPEALERRTVTARTDRQSQCIFQLALGLALLL